MGLRCLFAGRTPPWARHHQVTNSKKSAHYPASVKAFLAAPVDGFSLALVEGMFRRITLALMSAVPYAHHCDPQPGVAAGSHPRRIDI